MAQTNSFSFPTPEVERYAEVFKALSNPHRLRIFLQLVECCTPGTRYAVEDGGRACVGDLGRSLGIVSSTVSHHVKELVRSGLIRTERRGQKIDCWIDPEMLAGLSSFFRQSHGCVVPTGQSLVDMPGEETASNPGERT